MRQLCSRFSEMFGAAFNKTPGAVFLAAAATALLIALATGRKASPKASNHPLAALSQTYIAVNPAVPLNFPLLLGADGRRFGPQQLQGYWSVVFFGFTACPLVCPKTLSVLSAAASNPASGLSSGITQALFVSVDPEHDTPSRLAIYLSHFNGHILGLTGSREDLNTFGREIGAGFQPVGSSIDHSTSLFVVDPQGRLAGILLRPSNPSRIAKDLGALRLAYAEAGQYR